MIKHMIFRSDKIRVGFGAAVGEAVEDATRQATDWMNQYYDEINIKQVSTGIEATFVFVTVWYEMKEEAGS